MSDRFLGLYCERAGAGFWDEPLNALTNAAFLLAALLAFWLWRRERPRDRALLALIGVVMLIGIGSFLFHTVPSSVTVLLDVLPITAFVFGYLALALARFLGWGRVGVATGLGVMLVVSALLPRLVPPGFGNGSLGYLPPLAALALIGGALLLRARAELRLAADAAGADLRAPRRDARTAVLMLSAAMLFAVSLAARTLDRPLCASFPVGLHFVWHLLNAAVLFVLLSAAIRHAAGRGDA